MGRIVKSQSLRRGQRSELAVHLKPSDKLTSTLGRGMSGRYHIRRDFQHVGPWLGAIRTHADDERNALGFLPEPAYAEAARQRKVILRLSEDGGTQFYVGHLLFGGIFPILRVRQISIAKKCRRQGTRTTPTPRSDRPRRERRLFEHRGKWSPATEFFLHAELESGLHKGTDDEAD